MNRKYIEIDLTKYRIQHLANHFGKTRQTIHKWLKEGRVPYKYAEKLIKL